MNDTIEEIKDVLKRRGLAGAFTVVGTTDAGYGIWFPEWSLLGTNSTGDGFSLRAPDVGDTNEVAMHTYNMIHEMSDLHRESLETLDVLSEDTAEALQTAGMIVIDETEQKEKATNADAKAKNNNQGSN